MKIVQALGWYFPESLGGTETYVSALSRALCERGHEVLIVAPEPGARAERTYGHDGVEVYRYPVPRRPSRAEAQGGSVARGAEKLHAWLARARPDVFHCHSLVTGLSLDELEAAKKTGARIIVTFHTPGLGYLCQRGTMMRWGTELCDGRVEPRKCASCELQHRGVPRWLARWLGSLPPPVSHRFAGIPGRMGSALGMARLIAWNSERERRLFEIADGVVVLTEWARRTVEMNVGRDSRLHLNRLGVAASSGFERDAARKTNGLLHLGYLGRYDRIKGVEVLAKAVSALSSELRFELEIRGPLRLEESRRFRFLAKDDPRVRFEPAVSPERVPDVLRAYDVLICPSIAVEGGPTVALEAHAVGTPVIGSRLGGIAELIEDGRNGLLVPPGDVRALAVAIERVVVHPAETVDAWREHLPESRTMEEITGDYLRMYSL